MKKISTLLFAAFMACVTLGSAPALADGASWVNGGVGAGAFTPNGIAIINASYNGSGGTMSIDPSTMQFSLTQVFTAGGINATAFGDGGATLNGFSAGSAMASISEWGAAVYANSSASLSSTTGNNTFSTGDVTSMANGSAQTGTIWMPF